MNGSHMFNHEPPGYRCPFCVVQAGGDDVLIGPPDIVAETPVAFAVMSIRWWPMNRGHVLVVPRRHYENLYDLPPADGHAVHDLTRAVAIALRDTYGCDGVSTRQHNEPAGNQDVWHYHLHVFPRYHGDDLYHSRPLPEPVTPSERAPYVKRLRAYFGS